MIRTVSPLDEFSRSASRLGGAGAAARRLRRFALAATLMLCAATPAVADEWTDYADIGPDFLAFEAAYPTLCERYDAGLSYESRHLWVLHISDNVSVEEDEPEFRYVSTMHGDEIVGVKMCMNLIDYLLTNYGADPQATNIIDEVDLWIMPLMNPDGYDRASRTRTNAQGIDLNRNFPEGTDGDPNTTAGRAVETAVVMNWSSGRSFVASGNFHGGALVANYPFDNDSMGSVFSPTPDEDMFVYISEQYSQYNLPMWNGGWYHGITNGAEWYSIDGGIQDWSYRYMGCNDITFEVHNDKEPSASTIPTFWNDNRESMLAYIDTCLIGIRGLVTDAATGLPLAATVRVVGRDHDVYTDPDVGDYHRMLMPGTYDLEFSADGYEPKTVPGIVVSSGDATRVDVALGTPARVTWPNGGESLPTGDPATITWEGDPTLRFHVQYSGNYGVTAGETDGFEGAGLDPVYTTGGTAVWDVDSSDAYAGAQSARSGTISDYQTTWIRRTVSGGALSFWYRVSSESGWDFFNFYVDGDRKIHASGPSGAWTQYTTTLPAGSTYELEWEYMKDSSQDDGEDCAWIDELEITDDQTEWTDIVALTDVGAMSTDWVPDTPGGNYKVRVRAYYGAGGYGLWDESDATFAVTGVHVPDGDYNDDGHVDMRDFLMLQDCFGTVSVSACLGPFDFADDGAIDLADYAEFFTVFDGSSD